MQDMAAGLKEQQGNMNQNDFHSELMKLRQRWRLKRSGNLILGDLSYKSGEEDVY
jgi:mediator of RNA polymerase II transcription subunit 17